MTDWTPQDDWSQPGIGDLVRVVNSNGMLTGEVIDRYTYLNRDDVRALVILADNLEDSVTVHRDSWQLSVPAKPAVVLPDEPGIYVSHNEPPSPVIIHKIVDGRWVDADDENYLTEAGVIALMPLTKLEPVAVTAKKVLDRLERIAAINDDFFSPELAISNLRKEFGVTE